MAFRSFGNKDEGDIYTGTRVCSGCGSRQPMTEYYWCKINRFRVRKCKTCCGNEQRDRKNANRELYRKADFIRSLRVNHGLSIEEWLRLFEAQDRKCAICKDDLTKKKAYVDHCHSSGEIRGILYFSCNTGIGKLQDSVDILAAAIRYLQNAKPKITLRSRQMTKEEIKIARSVGSARFHRSEAGRKKLRDRALKFSGNNAFGVKLTDEQSEEIIRRYAQGNVSQQALADEYKVSQGCVSRLWLGRCRVGLREKIVNGEEA